MRRPTGHGPYKAGNVTGLFDTNLNQAAYCLYDPYGNPIFASGPLAGVNRYGFSSKEFTGNPRLTYFGRRFYDPGLQRWLNQDPTWENGGINLYAYVANDPVDYVESETATNSMANAACLIWRRKQLLGVRGLAAKAGAPSPIFIPNASTQGPPTSSAVQVNQGDFIAGFFTVKSPANRVRGATASGSASILAKDSDSCQAATCANSVDPGIGANAVATEITRRNGLDGRIRLVTCDCSFLNRRWSCGLEKSTSAAGFRPAQRPGRSLNVLPPGGDSSGKYTLTGYCLPSV